MEGYQREYLGAFYQTHYERLFLHAYAMLHERLSAEEAVQEAFQIACGKMEAFMDSENPLGWMRKTVEHTALHILREQQMAKALLSSLEDVPDPAAPPEQAAELTSQCLTVVSREELDFFLRIAMSGYTFAEEAKRLGINLAACYKRFERIRKRLWSALEENL